MFFAVTSPPTSTLPARSLIVLSNKLSGSSSKVWLCWKYITVYFHTYVQHSVIEGWIASWVISAAKVLTWQAVVHGVLISELSSSYQDILQRRNPFRRTASFLNLMRESCNFFMELTTPMASNERWRFCLIFAARFWAWSAIGCLSKPTLPTLHHRCCQDTEARLNPDQNLIIALMISTSSLLSYSFVVSGLSGEMRDNAPESPMTSGASRFWGPWLCQKQQEVPLRAHTLCWHKSHQFHGPL